MKKKRPQAKEKPHDAQAEVTERRELQELHHEAAPGYNTVFYIVFSLAVLYLGAIFLWR